MSEALAVLAVAALFAGFGWFQRTAPQRSCGAYTDRGCGASCPVRPSPANGEPS